MTEAAPALQPAVGPDTLAGRRPSVTVARLRAYLALTKPRIVELLLVTTLPTMMLARHGMPPIALAAATLAGGALAAGSANTINCYVDRDIDRLMGRTARRPLARGDIRPASALLFGMLLAAAGTAVLGFAVNWVAAALADAAIAFYVFVYTLGLKRRSPSNIVIGGAAGCFPVLVGWAAVTGTVALPAVLLFAVIFLWTPPHFWSLAMRFSSDYATAGVPMLPVVASPDIVARRILGYSYAMVAATLALAPFVGWTYAVAAALLGTGFLLEAHRLRTRIRRGGPDGSLRLFHASINYLTLLFLAVAVSSFLP